MNRRGFFKGLFGAAAAATAAAVIMPESVQSFIPTVLDPERELWLPGTKSFFIPSDTIAIKNIRPATLLEQKLVTGARMLRVRHTGWDILVSKDHPVDMISLIPEANFAAFAGVLQGAMEVHFDDGTIAYNVSPKDTLATARARAQGDKAVNDAKVQARKKYDQNWYPSRIPRNPDKRAWTRHKVLEEAKALDASPVITLD